MNSGLRLLNNFYYRFNVDNYDLLVYKIQVHIISEREVRVDLNLIEFPRHNRKIPISVFHRCYGVVVDVVVLVWSLRV